MGGSVGVTVSEVEEILRVCKIAIRPMAWAPRLSQREPHWYEFVSGLEQRGEVPEGLELRCQWKNSIQSAPAKFNFAVFWKTHRVYAIDVDPLGRHKNNKAGRGRPYWGQRIGGFQEHLWSDDGYGYAEPLHEQGLEDIVTAWALFGERAKVSLTGSFVHPDVSIQRGQRMLPL